MERQLQSGMSQPPPSMSQNQPNQIMYLDSSNFGIGTGTKGKLLFNNVPGISIILIYSTNCGVCTTVIPIFKQLPQYVDKCKFGVINIDKNKDVIAKSLETTMPIKYVPQIIIFHNGKPFVKYTGEKKLEPMVSFFRDTILRVQQSFNFSKQSEKKKETQIEEEFGRPYNVVCDADSDMCYLTDEELSNGKEDDCSGDKCCFLSDYEL
jgi:thiol-disulfide isomerase/thioredoxin